MGRDRDGYPLAGGGGVRAGRLAAMLRAGARGVHADEAAAELLVAHGHRTGHGELVRRFARVQGCADVAGVPVAGIGWQAAAGGLGTGGLACPASKADVLRLAASLGGGAPVSLPAVPGGLDHVSIALVARAVPRANGTRGATVTVPAPPRFRPGIDVAGAGASMRRGEGR